MARSLDALVARKWKIIRWRRCCRPTWLMLGSGIVMVTWCWCVASTFFNPLNNLKLYQVMCFHCFPNEFGQGIRWQHLGQGVMLWTLLSAASCGRFVMPEENFPDIVAWSRLELFLNVLSTGVLSVTIPRPISTHRRMESLFDILCSKSLVSGGGSDCNQWHQRLADAVLWQGTKATATIFGVWFRESTFYLFFEWQNRRCWCSAILLKMDVSSDIYIYIYVI